MRTGGEIGSIRRSLELDARAEAEIRAAGPRLLPEVPRWVERFYVRIVADPAAMAVLRDDGRIVRLQRSLSAWFAEVFSLPFDEAYERARGAIGSTHARIGLPQHLMITAMHGVRRDVLDSVARLWADDPAGAKRVGSALEKAFDLELALMLSAYRRRSVEVRRSAARALADGLADGALGAARREAAAAARCYAELLARADDAPERVGRWSARLARAIACLDRAAAPGDGASAERQVVELRDLCDRAVEEAALPPGGAVDVRVIPQDLRARVHAEALEVAITDLVEDAAARSPGTTVRLVVRPGEEDERDVEVEVRRGAPPAGSPEAPANPFGLAFAEHVAALHGGALQPVAAGPGGHAVKLRLGGARDAGRG